MTYLVNDKCIKCKYMDCVEVCPVDCFYEGENMLVIHPDECIDCGVCEPECPVDAIVADTAYEKDDKSMWLEINKKYDVVVLGVNSKGINWISSELNSSNSKTPLLLLTKGLSVKNDKLEILTNLFKNPNVSAVAGPCLAKDLSKRNKTGVVFTNKNIPSAEVIGKLVKTSYYFMDYSDDIVGVEMCAAIKNFYSMVIGSAKDLNTAAILMQKSVIEMGKFIKLFGGSEQTVYGLAGLGDLYVSIAGGRNRKMGQHLGEGHSYSEAKKKFMPNDTVEGAELAFEIGPKILKDLSKKDFPIMYSLVESICKDKKFVINFL